MSATFEVNEVEEILALMEQWGIAEVHLTVGDASLDLVRATPAVAPVAPAAPVPVSSPVPPSLPVPAELTTAPDAIPIPAPVVGLFHLARRGFPQGKPQVGDLVQAGQVIGSIELMHVPTDLISPVSGIIEGILVDEGAGVEYGQPIMIIRPFEEVSEDEAGMLPPPAR